LDVVEQDQTNEVAWFWLYQVFERYDDKRVCLENLILINPDNEWARQELHLYFAPPAPNFGAPAALAGEMAPAASPLAPARGRQKRRGKAAAPDLARPLTLKLVTAFWIGISIIFLGGGIMASGEWLVSGIRSRTFPSQITLLQIFELFIAFVFIIAGLTGLHVAVSLFFRSMAGFYGSLLLALGILLVGPTISLIAAPPNYPAMVCTGGISGMIVLLTLASHAGLKDTRQEHDPSG
jgi:hypothetical protein